MATCPVCQVPGIRLKKNSHTIPRFLILPTKRNGKNVFISPDGINEKNWRDIKGDFVCSPCEALFAKDDEFAKGFFDDEKYVKDRKEFLFSNGVQVGIEVYDNHIFLKLKRFAISVILRQHLYLEKYEGTDLLGPHFTPLRDAYWTNTINESNYPMCMARYLDDFTAVGYPSKERHEGINSIFFLIKQFRIWLYVDGQHRCPAANVPLVVRPSFVASLLTTIKTSRTYSDLRSRIRQFKKLK